MNNNWSSEQESNEISIQRGKCAGSLIPQRDGFQKKLQVDHWMQLKNEQTGECARIKLKTTGKITEVRCIKDLQKAVLNSIDKHLCTIGRPRHEVKKTFPKTLILN